MDHHGSAQARQRGDAAVPTPLACALRAPWGSPCPDRLPPLLWLGVLAYTVLGDVHTARDRFAQAQALLPADADPAVSVPLAAARAQAATFAGELREASVAARAALRGARAVDDPALLAVALAAESAQLAAGGERDAASDAGAELIALRDRARDAEIASIARIAVAPLLLDAGDADAAELLLADATAPEQLEPLHPLARSLLLELRVRAAVARGDREQARWQLATLDAAPYSRTPLGGAIAGCAGAVSALADDRPANAEARASGGAEAARRAPARLLELRATLLAGDAQALLGAPDVAIERYGEASAVAHAIGARPLAEAAGERRRRLIGDEGAGDADAGSREAHGLTDRQLEIARLAATGCSDREVAAMLDISEHTVHTHLRGAFARLGVRRRGALGAALARTPLSH